MKNKLLMLLTVMLSSCKGGYEITELYEQKILNSENSIVEYQAWSTLNYGSKYGYTLKGPTEVINIVDAEQMSFQFLADVPSSDTILNVELIQGEGRIPKYVSSRTTSIQDMVLVTDVYEYAIGSVRNFTCHFNGIQETQDSLILKGIEVGHFALPVAGNEIGFRKGNVQLVESREEIGVLEYVEIRAFVLRKYAGGLIDNVTILRNGSSNIYGQVIFKLTPKSRILIDDFSDVGTYKKKEIVNPRSL